MNNSTGTEQVENIDATKSYFPNRIHLCWPGEHSHACQRSSFLKENNRLQGYTADNGSGNRRSDNVSISCPFSTMLVRAHRHRTRKSYGHVAPGEPIGEQLIRGPCVECGLTIRGKISRLIRLKICHGRNPRHYLICYPSRNQTSLHNNNKKNSSKNCLHRTYKNFPTK